jgi:hypothetical protein
MDDEVGVDIAAVRGIEKTTDAFRVAFVEMCQRLGLNPDYMAAVVSFESGFDPAARNPISNAGGLIQFMPGRKGSAARLGYTTEQIRSMSAEDQVPLIERYMVEIVGMGTVAKAKNITDHYLLVFGSAGVGKGEDHPLYTSPSPAYEGNKALDKNGDGVITNGEASAVVKQILAESDGRPRIQVGVYTPVDKTEPLGATRAMFAFIVGGVAAYYTLRYLGKKTPFLRPSF